MANLSNNRGDTLGKTIHRRRETGMLSLILGSWHLCLPAPDTRLRYFPVLVNITFWKMESCPKLKHYKNRTILDIDEYVLCLQQYDNPGPGSID